jgi:hypothetical protein
MLLLLSAARGWTCTPQRRYDGATAGHGPAPAGAEDAQLRHDDRPARAGGRLAVAESPSCGRAWMDRSPLCVSSFPHFATARIPKIPERRRIVPAPEARSMRCSSGVDQLELGRTLDRRADRAVDGTARHVVLERSPDGAAVDVASDLQQIAHVDALDHQDAVLDLDLPARLPNKTAFACVDVTRLQRAAEGSRQSATRGGHDVIQRRRPLGIAGSCNAIVLGDLVVDAEVDRLTLTRYLRPAQRTSNTLDSHPRDVLHLTHARDVTGRSSTRRRRGAQFLPEDDNG